MASIPEGKAKGAVIRGDPLQVISTWGESLRAVPAWIISATIHAALFWLAWLVLADPSAQAREKHSATEPVNTVIETPRTEEPKLSGIDQGVEPSVPPGFDVNRIGEMNAPGPVDPSVSEGHIGDADSAPVSFPNIPGVGSGSGGGVGIEEIPGIGVPIKEGGGQPGIRHLPGGITHRSGATRNERAMDTGGSRESETAVGRGLRWLALHQAPQGYWSLDQFNLHARTEVNSQRYFNDNSSGKGMKNDTAGCAFGLLPFLAAGITHKPSGRPDDDQYVKTVKRALDWLIANQAKDGRFGGSTMYEHGLATIAICEAYGLTADPALKGPARKALDFIIKAQDPQGGGWRYQPRQGGDTSVVGWQVMALKSGQMSGLSVPNITLKAAEKYLDSCESTDGGGYGYTGPGDAPTMSAVGLLCRQYLGTPRRNANLRNGVEKLWKRYPPNGHNIYYEYYATQVFHHMGGEYWDNWNKGPDGTGKRGMRDLLVAQQSPDGSWDPRGDGHSGAGGRIMKTSLTLLTLEVYYRHLPLYQRVDTKK